MQHTNTAPPVSVENRVRPTIRTVAVVVAEPQPARTPPRYALTLLVAFVLLGSGLRAAAFLSDRALWIDEAMLALNLVDRTPRQLFDRLDYNQGAPIGFLLAANASVAAFGPSEWALRLVPFVASLFGLFAFAWVARRILPASAALLAVALYALSPHVVSYAGECKQYASDAAIAIALMAVAVSLLEGKGGFARYFTLALAGAVAVWCSHPAAFVLGGIGMAMLSRLRLMAASLTIACWLVSFGANYFLCLKRLGDNKYLTDFWAGQFLTLPPRGIGDLAWVLDRAIAFFTLPGGFGGALVPLGGLAAALALIGLREFARSRWPVAVAVALPAAFVLLASALHKYPVGGRLMLFMTPLAVLAVARGAWVVFESLAEKNRFAAFALLFVLVLAPLWEVTDAIRRPRRQEELKTVLAELRRDYRPGDRVYVYYGAVPAFTFYTRTEPFPSDAVMHGEAHRINPSGYRDELAKLHGRVWVVMSHRHGDEEATIRASLDCRGECERIVKGTGAAAYLYLLE